MISPIQATPNMGSADLANVVNDLGRQLESENRTKIIKDENGVARILLGLAPNGQYGLYITKPGTDVTKELQSGG